MTCHIIIAAFENAENMNFVEDVVAGYIPINLHFLINKKGDFMMYNTDTVESSYSPCKLCAHVDVCSCRVEYNLMIKEFKKTGYFLEIPGGLSASGSMPIDLDSEKIYMRSVPYLKQPGLYCRHYVEKRVTRESDIGPIGLKD